MFIGLPINLHAKTVGGGGGGTPPTDEFILDLTDTSNPLIFILDLVEEQE